MTIKRSFFLLPLFICLIVCLSCSVYKSQGRKSFESDTPTRVPIDLIFQCRSAQAPKATAQTINWGRLKTIPHLVISQTIYQETVLLLAKSVNPDLTCISEGLDLKEFNQIQDIF